MRNRTALLVLALAVLGMISGALWVFLAPRTAAGEPGVPVRTRETATPMQPVEIAELPPGEAGRASAETFPRDEESPSASQESVARNEIAAPIDLVGNVTDVDGHLLGGERSRVWATDSNGRALQADILAGVYRLEDLEPGTWDIRCSVKGFRDVARSVELSAESAEHREDFVLQPDWTIAVRLVTGQGEEFDAALSREELPLLLTVDVVAAKEPPGERLTPGSLAWRRAHRMSRSQEKKDGARVLVVSEEPPVTVCAVAAGSVLASQVAATYVDAMTLVIPMEGLQALPCSLVVRVADADTGDPVPGIPVQLLWPRGGEGGEPKVTDAEGIAHAENLLPGPCTLALIVPRYAPRWLPLDLQPGTRNDLGTISLDRGVSLRGRFVDPDGRGVACDASVDPYVESNPLESLPRQVKMGVHPDEDGSFRVEKLTRGMYLLNARTVVPTGDGPNWQSGPILVDLSSGSVEGLEIQVRPAVEVRLEPATPLLRELIPHISTSQGLPCTRAYFPNVGPGRVQLVPGSYELLLDRDGTIVKRIPFTLGEKPMTLAVDL